MTHPQGRDQTKQSGRKKWRVDVSSAVEFEELKRTEIGFSETGQYFKISVNKSEFKKRFSFALALCCENENILAVRFANAKESAALNKEYRKKSQPTDVLSFSAFQPNMDLVKLGLSSVKEVNLGDLCVCVPVCLVQAKEHRVTLASEMERMIVHGICHLKGFDHERSEASETTMIALEKSIRTQIVNQFGRACWVEKLGMI